MSGTPGYLGTNKDRVITALASLGWGVVFCAVTALVTALLLSVPCYALLVYNLLPPSVMALWLVRFTCLIVTGVFFWGVFTEGLRKIVPGKIAYVSILDYPLMRIVGVGTVWIIPRLMQIKEVSSQAFDVAIPSESYLTGDGLPINITASATLRVAEPLRFQSILPSAVEGLVQAQMRAATRAYIALQNPGGTGSILQLNTMSTEEKNIFFQKLLAFKGDLSGNGANGIREAINNALVQYGLTIDPMQLQVTDVAMEEEVEDAIERIYTEIFESLGLAGDAQNKKSVAATLLTLFADNGINLTELAQKDPDAASKLVSDALDRAMAIEKIGTYATTRFTGNQPPTGMIYNP